MNAKDENGNTPLHFACERGTSNTVKCLIEKGADVNSKNKRGQTPLDLARICENFEVIEYLDPTPPPTIHEITLPNGIEDIITKEDIVTGDIIVDFHNEFRYERYYKQSTLQLLNNKNPLTKTPINKADITHYRVTLI